VGLNFAKLISADMKIDDVIKTFAVQNQHEHKRFNKLIDIRLQLSDVIAEMLVEISNKEKDGGK
jgi:hypothetical protein